MREGLHFLRGVGVVLNSGRVVQNESVVLTYLGSVFFAFFDEI